MGTTASLWRYDAIRRSTPSYPIPRRTLRARSDESGRMLFFFKVL
jgi:hypothetical protein